eukprot:COSAG02_NODE_2783_length_8036_cov_41.488976_3_plen_200_part_00
MRPATNSVPLPNSAPNGNPSGARARIGPVPVRSSTILVLVVLRATCYLHVLLYWYPSPSTHDVCARGGHAQRQRVHTRSGAARAGGRGRLISTVFRCRRRCRQVMIRARDSFQPGHIPVHRIDAGRGFLACAGSICAAAGGSRSEPAGAAPAGRRAGARRRATGLARGEPRAFARLALACGRCCATADYCRLVSPPSLS